MIVAKISEDLWLGVKSQSNLYSWFYAKTISVVRLGYSYMVKH